MDSTKVRPQPLDTGGTLDALGAKWDKLFRFLALDRLQARLHRWRFNLVTGEVKEEQLSESITEFGTINPDYAAGNYRYAYAATGKPGWFLFDGLVKHDLRTGGEQHYQFADGVFGSEAAMAPRPNSTGEDDGYLITLTTDMNADASYCVIFDAARVQRRAGVQNCSARTDFQRHPRHLGTGRAVAPLA